MPKKKAEAALPRYTISEELDAILDILEMLARQSGVAEIREKVEELKATLKG